MDTMSFCMKSRMQESMDPGKTQKSNLRFLVFLASILKALDTHADILRAYIASAGNDLRLGAHEAPPAIISAFIGKQLSETLDAIEKTDRKAIKNAGARNGNNINIPKIPEILIDNTDRNRTSPFAFTGNKFEFRAVGSSSSCARPMIALNVIVADQLRKFSAEVDALIASNRSKEDALFEVIRSYIIDSKRIRFEGNNYGEEWIKEAKKRGLSNVPGTPYALKSLLKPASIQLFEDHNVLTEREVRAHHEITLENYVRKIQIESRVMGDLALNHIIPIAIRYQNLLIENVKGLKEVLDSKTYTAVSKTQIDTIKEISSHISVIKEKVVQMVEERRLANLNEDIEKFCPFSMTFVTTPINWN